MELIVCPGDPEFVKNWAKSILYAILSKDSEMQSWFAHIVQTIPPFHFAKHLIEGLFKNKWVQDNILPSYLL